MKTLKGYLLIITGFAACPCHLPITLPLLLALTAGTAVGAFLANNVWVIVVISTIYFVVAFALGWRYVTQDEKVCNVSLLENSYVNSTKVVKKRVENGE